MILQDTSKWTRSCKRTTIEVHGKKSVVSWHGMFTGYMHRCTWHENLKRKREVEKNTCSTSLMLVQYIIIEPELATHFKISSTSSNTDEDPRLEALAP